MVSRWTAGKLSSSVSQGATTTIFWSLTLRLSKALVVPVLVDRDCIGTIWIAAHSEQTHFTLTDVRVMESLASFTGAAISLMRREPSHRKGAAS